MLEHTLKPLITDDKNLLVGIESHDDASVYKIATNLALVQSLDYITPIVDEPFTYGQIAAANSLSDIFAMGTKALNALNIVGFDSCNLNKEILQEILAGGNSKIQECKARLTGGHTIESLEMFYGLSVSGLIKPHKIWRNNTAKIGDVLILTKAIGTGIVSTAIKAQMASKEEIQEISASMTQLNYKAMKVLKKFKISACTDISGFGLLGHASEMINKNISLKFYKDEIPYFKSALKYAKIGLIPEGSYKNKDFLRTKIENIDNLQMELFDAQTSGGFLFTISPKDASLILDILKNESYEHSSIIGEVTAKSTKDIFFT